MTSKALLPGFAGGSEMSPHPSAQPAVHTNTATFNIQHSTFNIPYQTTSNTTTKGTSPHHRHLHPISSVLHSLLSHLAPLILPLRTQCKLQSVLTSLKARALTRCMHTLQARSSRRQRPTLFTTLFPIFTSSPSPPSFHPSSSSPSPSPSPSPSRLLGHSFGSSFAITIAFGGEIASNCQLASGKLRQMLKCHLHPGNEARSTLVFLFHSLTHSLGMKQLVIYALLTHLH